MRVPSIILGVVLAFASVSASAFEESTGAVAPTEQAAGSKSAPKAPLNLEGTGTSVDTTIPPAAGTEVRIPGLGKLGMLPKFDFGLELLYGEQKSGPTPGRAGPGDDMEIRGSFKHRF